MKFYEVSFFLFHKKGMSTMIKIRIRNADHEIDIRFPISESELFAKLGEIHAVEGRDAALSVLVTDVYWPEEFSMLKDRFANLDELNYREALLIVLKNAINDQYDYIDWWLYEGVPDYKIWNEDESIEWDLTEPEALYDFITTECK